MINVWIDTNILVRFVTHDAPEQSRQVVALMRRAERGEIALRVPGVVIAEAVWVLGSVYSLDRGRIGDALRQFVLADGVAADDPDVVMDALRLMHEKNVAYVDAHVAALARAHGEAVATFDADFRRLGVELMS